MSKRTTLMVLGILVALSPFIGLPYSWLMWLLPVLGILIAYLGYSRGRRIVREEPPIQHDAEPVV